MNSLGRTKGNGAAWVIVGQNRAIRALSLALWVSVSFFSLKDRS